MSWPRITATGMPRTWVTGLADWRPRPQGAPWSRLLRRERAQARDRPEGLLARHHLDHLVIVPGILRLLRRLDLHHVHVVDHDAVGTDVAAPGEHVVDLRPLEFRHHRVGVGGA